MLISTYSLDRFVRSFQKLRNGLGQKVVLQKKVPIICIQIEKGQTFTVCVLLFLMYLNFKRKTISSNFCV